MEPIHMKHSLIRQENSCYRIVKLIFIKSSFKIVKRSPAEAKIYRCTSKSHS